jgi:hypothetical protein
VLEVVLNPRETQVETKVSRKKKKKQQKKVVVQHPVDHVVKLEPLEAALFGKSDAEIRNALQGIKIAELELKTLETDYQTRKTFLTMQRQKLTQEVEVLKAGYSTVVQQLAEKYDIAPENMTINPDTGVIHDVRGTKAEESTAA